MNEQIYTSVVFLNLPRIAKNQKIYEKNWQETHQVMRIPERDVTYIVLSVYILTLIHRYPLNQKQSH